MHQPEYQLHNLSNGIRLAYRRTEHTRVSHCGLFIDSGSRDESENEIGLAHLLEHMLFKGTRKRNVHQVLNRLEVVGGDLNAYTTKDKTCIYATIVNEEIDRALELLGDVSFNSAFPEKELKKEKKVISEEIDMYLDTPEERIYDEFQELFYPGHPLGSNILGSKDQLNALSRDDLFRFHNRTFLANRMILAVVTPVSEKRVLQMAEKHFGSAVLQSGESIRIPPATVKPFDSVMQNGFLQTHTLLGCAAYPLAHPLRPTLMLLSNILAGPGLNSRLNLALRERLGYTYSVESSYQCLTDSGLFTIYWSTDKRNARKSRKAVLNVIRELIEKPLSDIQLRKYKTQFKGQMVIAEESNHSLLFVMGKSLLDLNTFDTLPEVLARIDSITATELQQVAQEILSEDRLSFLTYMPD